MELAPYVSSLRSALAAAGNAASDEVREAADRLSYAVEPSLRLSLIEALSDAAADITTQLEGISVDVRMRGGNPDLVVSDAPLPADVTPEEQPPPSHETTEDGEDGMARISLRIPERLKTRVEAAASAEGVSVNAWLVRMASQALDAPQAGIHVSPQSGVHINVGRRVSGWAR